MTDDDLLADLLARCPEHGTATGTWPECRCAAARKAAGTLTPAPVYDAAAWATYSRDAGCGCTAPDPADCTVPHGTGAWLCVCHRLAGPTDQDTVPGEPLSVLAGRAGRARSADREAAGASVDWHAVVVQRERELKRSGEALARERAAHEEHRRAVCEALGRHTGLDWPTAIDRVQQAVADRARLTDEHEAHRLSLADTLGEAPRRDWEYLIRSAGASRAEAVQRAAALHDARDALGAAGHVPDGDDWPAVAPAIRQLSADLVLMRGNDEVNRREAGRRREALAAVLGLDRNAHWDAIRAAAAAGADLRTALAGVLGVGPSVSDDDLIAGVRDALARARQYGELEAKLAAVQAIKRAPSRSADNWYANAQDDGWDQAVEAVRATLSDPQSAHTERDAHEAHRLALAAALRWTLADHEQTWSQLISRVKRAVDEGIGSAKRAEDFRVKLSEARYELEGETKRADRAEATIAAVRRAAEAAALHRKRMTGADRCVTFHVDHLDAILAALATGPEPARTAPAETGGCVAHGGPDCVCPETGEADRAVAYRAMHRALLCRRCCHGGDAFAPVTSEELPDGGLCANCGGDVLIALEPEPSAAPLVIPADAARALRAALGRALGIRDGQ